MKYKIVAVRDNAIGTFAQPWFVPSIGAAVRAFGDEVKREGSNGQSNPLNMHPNDFDLYDLGVYDDDGVFETHIPNKIASGVDYKG